MTNPIPATIRTVIKIEQQNDIGWNDR